MSKYQLILIVSELSARKRLLARFNGDPERIKTLSYQIKIVTAKIKALGQTIITSYHMPDYIGHIFFIIVDGLFKYLGQNDDNILETKTKKQTQEKIMDTLLNKRNAWVIGFCFASFLVVKVLICASGLASSLS